MCLGMVYAHLFVWVCMPVYVCAFRRQKSTLCVLFYHSSLCSFQTGSLTRPGALLVTSKPQSSSCFHFLFSLSWHRLWKLDFRIWILVLGFFSKWHYLSCSLSSILFICFKSKDPVSIHVLLPESNQKQIRRCGLGVSAMMAVNSEHCRPEGEGRIDLMKESFISTSFLNLIIKHFWRSNLFGA